MPNAEVKECEEKGRLENANAFKKKREKSQVLPLNPMSPKIAENKKEREKGIFSRN